MVIDFFFFFFFGLLTVILLGLRVDNLATYDELLDSG